MVLTCCKRTLELLPGVRDACQVPAFPQAHSPPAAGTSDSPEYYVYCLEGLASTLSGECRAVAASRHK
jgi:hypothetical protein